MSTFDGIVAEFPEIRVDYFRKNGTSQPLACFLSHIHSDHLAGLESLRSPFVYCSAATREMLLLLEKYPCRINYVKGILEARVQTYRHLKTVLKPLPLETPTIIELQPGHDIQVTLFDANHCPGSVMFLFEGNGSAVLYTGDIRSEPWHVQSLSRHPCLLEYTLGSKILDKIYLDTSFTNDVHFQTKGEGIAELLRKVSAYPSDTIFHLQAWTFGYEQVWVALSKALGSKIHVDTYKMRLYSSLKARDSANRYGSQVHMIPEAPYLVGFMCANSEHPGCLTSDQNVRLHCCERGNYCEVVRKSPVVFIQPIIAHLSDGHDLAEMGVGGGGVDFEREAELEHPNTDEIKALIDLCVLQHVGPKFDHELTCGRLHGQDDTVNTDHGETENLLRYAALHGRNAALNVDISAFDDNSEATLSKALETFTRNGVNLQKQKAAKTSPTQHDLPNKISFPYSRHSSYHELRDLVKAFRPRDVWPCTVDSGSWQFHGETGT